MTERVYVDYPEGSFKDRCFQEMVRKFGKDTAGDIFWLEEEVCCLYQPPKKSMLVVDLRNVAWLATKLARKVDREELGIWRTLVKEIRWWFFVEKHYLIWEFINYSKNLGGE